MSPERVRVADGRRGRGLPAVILLLAQLLVLALPHTDFARRGKVHFDATPHADAEHAPCLACTATSGAAPLPAGQLAAGPALRESSPRPAEPAPPLAALLHSTQSRAPPSR